MSSPRNQQSLPHPAAAAEPAPALAWLDTQGPRLAALVERWANINSGSTNIAGLNAMAAALREDFAVLGVPVEVRPLPPYERIDDDGQCRSVPVGPALILRKHPGAGADAPLRVLLAIHMDTVYGVEHSFQKCEQIEAGDAREKTPGTTPGVRGPGVTDAKGGLAILLAAVEALERSPHAPRLGWTIIINPDEELGSPSSAGLFAEEAARHDLGLLFEPSLTEDGVLVGSRKGSGNFTLVVRGRAAHAGRDPEAGRNAVVALARTVVRLDELGRQHAARGVTINVARIVGGTVLNVVPDLALARFNVRVAEAGQIAALNQAFEQIVAQLNQVDGITAQLQGSFHCPPKPLDDTTRQLLSHIEVCGREIGLTIRWQSSGGVSDGNKLAAAGLPNVDSLGARGGAIHSAQEYLCLDSLVERARLTALLLMKLAAEELPWPTREKRIAP